MKLQKFSGNWLTIWVHLTRQFQLQGSTQTNEETVETFFASWHLKNLPQFWISSTLFGYGMYFFFGIAFHVRQFIFKRFSLFSWTSLTKNNWILRKKSKKKKNRSCLKYRQQEIFSMHKLYRRYFLLKQKHDHSLNGYLCTRTEILTISKIFFFVNRYTHLCDFHTLSGKNWFR